MYSFGELAARKGAYDGINQENIKRNHSSVLIFVFLVCELF